MFKAFNQRIIKCYIHHHLLINNFCNHAGPKRLEKNVEEGICELMGFKWMNWCMDNKYISDDPFVKRLTSHYKFAVARMDGFKEAWDVVQKHGLKNTLEHLVNTRSFPKC